MKQNKHGVWFCEFGPPEVIKPKNDIILDKDLIDFQEGKNNWFPDVEFINDGSDKHAISHNCSWFYPKDFYLD